MTMSRRNSPVEREDSLVDKPRTASSPVLRNLRGKASLVEDGKIKIHKDILDSLKESDGLPALIYPQDYIYDIAHLHPNGNLDELIDDMSTIDSPEERFEMVKSENKLLRERLYNALQREMKAIKTFQKLAHDNRLMHLKVKGYENANKSSLSQSDHVNSTENKSTNLINGNNSAHTINGGHRTLSISNLDNTPVKTTVDKSTSTVDLKYELLTDRSESTNDLYEKTHFNREDGNEKDTRCVRERSDERVKRHEKNVFKQHHQKDLYKTKSSPNIMQGTEDFLNDQNELRMRSVSLNFGISDGNLQELDRSLSSETISSSINVINTRSSEKRVISVPSNLDVVNEESDFNDNKSVVNRSSFSSAETTHSPSSDVESNSPCHTPGLEKEFPESFPVSSTVSCQNLQSQPLCLPSTLKKEKNSFQSKDDKEINDDSNEQKSPPARNPRRNTGDFPRRKILDHHVSTRSLPAKTSKVDEEKVDGTKEGSSSEESDKDQMPSPSTRRRLNNVNVASDIQKFQKMYSNSQMTQLSQESDNEDDILRAYHAEHGVRRGSAVVQIPMTSIQMDLHIPHDDPHEDDSVKNKRLDGSQLGLDDIKTRSSKWSILKNKKKTLKHQTTQKDRLRMLEDLKVYLSSIIRPKHIASEMELSLYKESHWTNLISVTDESGVTRRLSQVNNATLPEAEMKRREAVWELFHSEVVYLTAHLLVLKECFLEPLQDIQNKGFLLSVNVKKIFSNLEDLCKVSAEFAQSLLHLFKDESKNDQFGSTASVVAAFTSFESTVHPQYKVYCLSYTKTLNYLESLKKTKHVQDFFRWCESDPRCNRLKLTDLLVAPFQHLTKYPLLLKNIRKRTSEADNQHVSLTTTIESVEDLIQELEGKVTVIRNYQQLKDIQKNLVWPSVADLDPKSYVPEYLRSVLSHQECEDILASPKRQLLYEGPLTLYEHAKSEITAFLFDDMLLLTTAKSAKKSNKLRKLSSVAAIQEMPGVSSPLNSRKTADQIYTVWKQPLPIDRFILYDLDRYTGNSIKHGFVLLHMSRFKQAIGIHTLQAQSEDIKKIWLNKLRDAQTKWNNMIEHEEMKYKKAATSESKRDSDESEVNSDNDNVETNDYSGGDVEEVFAVPP